MKPPFLQHVGDEENTTPGLSWKKEAAATWVPKIDHATDTDAIVWEWLALTQTSGHRSLEVDHTQRQTLQGPCMPRIRVGRCIIPVRRHPSHLAKFPFNMTFRLPW